jgi:hypothetical protein
MRKPTRDELLAEYYLRGAGVAAVWIDAAGHVGAQDVASIGIKSEGNGDSPSDSRRSFLTAAI